MVLAHLRRYYKNVYIIALICFLMYFYFPWKGILRPEEEVGRSPIFIIINFMIRSYKSSRSQMFFKKGVLKNFTILTRKHLCWNLFVIQLQSSSPATILKSNSSTGDSWKAQLLLKYNEIAFWSWNIIFLNLLWRTYFMCILLSDCTRIVIRLKSRRD